MEMSSGGNSIHEEVLARARKHYEEGVSLRQEVRFGEALNAFMAAIAAVDEALSTVASGSDSGAVSADVDASLLEIRSRSEASIGLLREIIGFVNTDLMNP